MQRAFEAATVAAFIAALFLPLVIMQFGPSLDVSTMEQRRLGSWPAPPRDARSLERFPRRTERTFTDRMGLRLELTRAQAALEIAAFGTSPTPKLVAGRDGWLFFGDAHSVAHVRGVGALTPRAVSRWADVLEARRRWLAKHGAEFLFVLVPDKHHVYREHLPRHLPIADGTHPIEQLAGELERRGTVPTLDLLPVLEAAKARERIYHKTDTHWNDRGAHVAYAAILQAAGERLPALADDRPIDVIESSQRTPGLGLARIVGLGRAYHEDMITLTPARPAAAVPASRRAAYEERVTRQLPLVLGTGDPTMPRAVVFRDSFANALVPFLSEHFERVVWVWDRDVLPEVVLRERPDLVIQEVVGRFLDRRPNRPWELLAKAKAKKEAKAKNREAEASASDERR